MIKNIIFDFGDIFINLNKVKFAEELDKLGVSEHDKEIKPVLNKYEMGLISSEEFLQYFYERYNISKEKLALAWNSILLDFPLKRLDFLKDLVATKRYKIFLLSNTNDMHISWIQENWGNDLYNEFKSCFKQFYLSQEIHFRKPNADIFEFVLTENKLVPEETLFIDDTKENTDTAHQLNIHTWHLIPGEEDVTQLFTKMKNLF